MIHPYYDAKCGYLLFMPHPLPLPLQMGLLSARRNRDNFIGGGSLLGGGEGVTGCGFVFFFILVFNVTMTSDRCFI